MSIFYFANNHIELQLLILTIFLHAEQMTYAKAYHDKLFLATRRSRNLTFLVTVFTPSEDVNTTMKKSFTLQNGGMCHYDFLTILEGVFFLCDHMGTFE